MSPISSSLRSTEPAEPRSLAERASGPDLDNIFRLSATGQERARPSTQGSVAEPRRVGQSELDSALDMLGRAAKAMDLLQARYQKVENYAKELAERAERDLSAAYSQAKECEGRAVASETRLEEMKLRVAEAEHRAELAERRAEMADRRAEHAENRADHAERGAAESREWLECFYDKIVASFDGRPLVKPAAA